MIERQAFCTTELEVERLELVNAKANGGEPRPQHVLSVPFPYSNAI